LPDDSVLKEKRLSGSKKWPVTAWRVLLERALGVLDEIRCQQADFTFGGGTALALRIHHRVSYDVDLFLRDHDILRALSPNRNRAARDVTDRWQEPGNYLRLECAEGAIDFIVAGRQTELPPWLYRFMDRDIQVEEPAEIIAKKLKYRGSRLLPRDIFDLLAVQRADPTQIMTAVAAAPDGARRAADRIERIAVRYRATIADEVNPTPSGLELLAADPLTAALALRG
jgi:hypothetical protein